MKEENKGKGEEEQGKKGKVSFSSTEKKVKRLLLKK
jgi:hypothetical protein